MAKVQIRAANVNDVPEGRVLRVDLEGRPILLSRCGEHFAAIDAICSHVGGRLEDGEIDEACIICPIHGARFDLASGKLRLRLTGQKISKRFASLLTVSTSWSK